MNTTITAMNIFKKALTLLGYAGNEGELSGAEELLPRAIGCVDIIYSDIYYLLSPNGERNTVTKASDVIDLPKRVADDVMPYGVAMLIAQNEGDGDSQQLFASYYNQKRASLTNVGTRKDTQPQVIL